MKCECTDDHLCKVAQKLWRLKSRKGRNAYSNHRMLALGLLDTLGRPDKGVESIWADNMKKTKSL